MLEIQFCQLHKELIDSYTEHTSKTLGISFGACATRQERIFAQMSPTRNDFWLEWKQEKGGKWGYKKLKSLKEARRVLDSDIRKALELVRGA